MLELSYKRAVAVTPSDATVLLKTRAIYVGGAGALALTINGVNVTFAAVPAGTTIRIEATRVRATGTAATSIVALY